MIMAFPPLLLLDCILGAFCVACLLPNNLAFCVYTRLHVSVCVFVHVPAYFLEFEPRFLVLSGLQTLDRFGWLFGETEPSQPKVEEWAEACFGLPAGDEVAATARGEAIYPFGGQLAHSILSNVPQTEQQRSQL